jgi:tetratricopeptide (TPR) repeat protein
MATRAAGQYWGSRSWEHFFLWELCSKKLGRRTVKRPGPRLSVAIIDHRYCLVLVAVLLCGTLLAGDDYESLFRRAASLSSQRKYAEAVQCYQAALKIRPDAPEALNNLAVMYYALGHYEQAWKTATHLIHSQQDFPSVDLVAGLSAVRIGIPAEAIGPLERIVRREPANRDAVLGLASAHIALNQVPEAAAIYEQEIKRSPDDSVAWYGLAICNERMAEAASKALAEMPGGRAYSKQLLGEYLLSRGDERLAQEAFGESAASAATSSPEAARQFETAKSLAKASQAAFERFLEIAPDSWQSHLFLGDLNRQHRKFADSLAEYKKAAAAQPQDPGPLLGIGTVYWELGDFDRAEQYLQHALQLNPDSMTAIFELGNIDVRRHRDAEAIPLLTKYLKAQPDALSARADLGRAYLHLEKFADAARELRLALPADTQGEIHYQMSLALRKLGHLQEADEALHQSAAIRRAELQREQRLHSVE